MTQNGDNSTRNGTAGSHSSERDLQNLKNQTQMKQRKRILLKREVKRAEKEQAAAAKLNRVVVQEPHFSPPKFFVFNLPKWEFRFLIEKVSVSFPLKDYNPKTSEEESDEPPPDLTTLFERGISSVFSEQTNTLNRHSEDQSEKPKDLQKEEQKSKKPENNENHKQEEEGEVAAGSPPSSPDKDQEKDLKPEIRKFYRQRHYLFSRFDDGIQLDVQSWYSVTPEEIALYIAKYCKGLRIFDGFAGAGGNLIQFAKVLREAPLPQNNHVLGCDIDRVKVKLARHNLKVYQVPTEMTRLMTSDFFKITNEKLMAQGYKDGKVDVLFLSPPWGGPDYLKGKYKLSAMKPSFQKIMYHASLIATCVVLFLPRNLELRELLECVALQAFEQRDNEFWVRWEQVFRGNQLKVNVFYLGRFLVDFTKEQLEYFDMHAS